MATFVPEFPLTPFAPLGSQNQLEMFLWVMAGLETVVLFSSLFMSPGGHEHTSGA